MNIFFIASKMNTLPFDIEWGIKNNDSDKSNISVYYTEMKSEYNIFYFKIYKKYQTLNFSITNIKEDECGFYHSFYEELNSYVQIMPNQFFEDTYNVNLTKNQPKFLIFNSINYGQETFLNFSIDLPSEDFHQDYVDYITSEISYKEGDLLNRNMKMGSTFTIYDNNTYRIYNTPYSFRFGNKIHYYCLIIRPPPKDGNIAIKFYSRNTNLYSFDSYYNFFGKEMYTQIGYKINVYSFYILDEHNYKNDLLYFLIRKNENISISYYYDVHYHHNTYDEYYSHLDNLIQLKNMSCKQKVNKDNLSYEYCEIDRNKETEDFYFVYFKNIEDINKGITIKSCLVDESKIDFIDYNNFIIFDLNEHFRYKTIGFGNYKYNETFYVYLELEFKNKSNVNDNINKIQISLSLNNRSIDNYFEFDFKWEGFESNKKIFYKNKYYYSYKSIYKYNITSGILLVKDLSDNPNCTIKIGNTYEDPYYYNNEIISLNEGKYFFNQKDKFIITLDLSKEDINKKILVLTFKGEKDSFISDSIDYTISNSLNNINGDYLNYNCELEEIGNEVVMKAIFTKLSKNIYHIILELEKNIEIYIKSEIYYYEKDFRNEFYFESGKKYIITKNILNEDSSHYIFYSSEKNFNISEIKYNFINDFNVPNLSFNLQIKNIIETNNYLKQYATLLNKNKNSTLLIFITDNITYPFNIIKTQNDESEYQYINNSIYNLKFNVKENKTLLFSLKINEHKNNIYFQLTSNFLISNFNKLEYICTYGNDEIISYDNQRFLNFNDEIYKNLNIKNISIIIKEIINKNINIIWFRFNITTNGEIELISSNNISELVNIPKIYDLDEYKLNKGINFITTERNNLYNIIFKYEKNESLNNIYFINYNFKDKDIININDIYNCTIKEDKYYKYHFCPLIENYKNHFTFVVLYNSNSQLLTRFTDIDEINPIKVLDFGEYNII